MTTDHPRLIYQMRFAVEKSGNVGCIFADEEERLDQDQTFVYVLPLESPGDDWRKYSYRFPASFGDKYMEFDAGPEPKTEFLAVQVKGTVIRFSPSPALFARGIPAPQGFPPQPLAYIGKDPLVGKYRWFLPLYPVDTIALDELYEREKVALVGLTPQFQTDKH